MRRGFASALRGSRISSSPFLNFASILLASTDCGSVNVRLNLPKLRSERRNVSGSDSVPDSSLDSSLDLALDLSIDDIFSLEQMVIDKEILDSIERFMNGFEFGAEADTLQIIRDSLDTGNFFTHPTTLENFRGHSWFPTLFDRRMLGSWQADGSRTIREKARQIAREKIAAQPTRVDQETERELDSLFEKAAKELSPG